MAKKFKCFDCEEKFDFGMIMGGEVYCDNCATEGSGTGDSEEDTEVSVRKYFEDNLPRAVADSINVIDEDVEYELAEAAGSKEEAVKMIRNSMACAIYRKIFMEGDWSGYSLISFESQHKACNWLAECARAAVVGEEDFIIEVDLVITLGEKPVDIKDDLRISAEF